MEEVALKRVYGLLKESQVFLNGFYAYMVLTCQFAQGSARVHSCTLFITYMVIGFTGDRKSVV